jgi:predicted double-glycine peptidase
MRSLVAILPCGIAALAASGLLAACGQLHADGSGAVAAVSSSATSEVLLVPVRSMAETKFNTVVHQRYDFSCGSAALATLLHFHYGGSQDEEATFRGMWAKGDRDQIRRLGFSLLDMKRYLASLGLSSDGFKVGLDQIAKTHIPGIALITIRNYRHFVVVKGLNADEVLLGDPATGLRAMRRADFVKNWNGIYFVLNSEVERGRAHFNTPYQWAQYPRIAPNAVFLQPLSQQALALAAPFVPTDI